MRQLLCTLGSAVLLLAALPLQGQEVQDFRDFIVVEDQDPITDEDISVMVTDSEGVIRAQNSPELQEDGLGLAEVDLDGAYFAVRCRGETFDVVLRVSEYVGDGPVEVTWRFDKKEPQSSEWETSRSGDGLFAPISGKYGIVQEARRARQLAVRLEDARSVRHTYTFDLMGFTRAAAQLGCAPDATDK